MTGLPIESLSELLRNLGRERSLRGRLRVLGRAWELLRSLTPAEREQVALRVGSSWAWKRVEKSFLRDGELDETEQLVGRVFEQLGDADPTELRELASLVRKGDRQGAQDLLLMTLQEALEEEAAEEEAVLGHAEAAAGKEPPDDDRVAAGKEPPDDAHAAPGEGLPDDIGLSVEDLMDARKSAAALEVRIESPAEPAPQPEPARRPEPEIVDNASGVLASTLARRVAPTQDPAPPILPVVEQAARPRAALVGQPVGGPVLHLPTAAMGGAERLRVLRSLDRGGRAGAELGRQGRAQLVESLGGGWASRRALSRMIAAGALDDLAEALHLIGRLTRNGQRIWCLADLVEHRELDENELARVLDAAPSAAARRRLAQRAQTSGRPAGVSG